MKKNTDKRTQYSQTARRLLMYSLIYKNSKVTEDKGTTIDDIVDALSSTNSAYLQSIAVPISKYSEVPSERTIRRDIASIRQAIMELSLLGDFIPDIPTDLIYDKKTRSYYFTWDESDFEEESYEEE